MTGANESIDGKVSSIAAAYRRSVERAGLCGNRLEVLAVHDGETSCWSVSARSIGVLENHLVVDVPEGIVSLPFAGPDAPAILPMLTPMDAAWRRRNSARREMRRISEGRSVVQVTDGSQRITIDPALVMVTTCGIFTPHVQGMTWDETDSLHADGPVLNVRSAERTLAIG